MPSSFPTQITVGKRKVLMRKWAMEKTSDGELAGVFSDENDADFQAPDLDIEDPIGIVAFLSEAGEVGGAGRFEGKDSRMGRIRSFGAHLDQGVEGRFGGRIRVV